MIEPDIKELIEAGSALVKELSKHMNGISIYIEQVETSGEWGKNRAAAMQRDIDRAESVQSRMLDAMEAVLKKYQENPDRQPPRRGTIFMHTFTENEPMSLMQTYESLSEDEQNVIERALDELKFEARLIGVRMLNTDPAAVAAEALAVYYLKSKKATPLREA